MFEGIIGGSPVFAAETGTSISPGLVIPPMDPVAGKNLFASKSCVVCHSVNGVGGTDAPPIDATAMENPMSPFDFFAKMWNHAYGMIAMQEDEIGEQITFENGQQLADIIAFLHDAEVQKTFTEGDIPPDVAAHMDED
ncbi:MAG: cytochrome c [Hyphomicrobiaceae bacterium]|nr:cytochrome c [Hyphomicrobiaceae bacterium]